MITITEPIYQRFAEKLLENVENKNFFNGTIEFDSEEFYSQMRLTLIICRDNDTDKILSILPVWWEYNLYMEDGEQLHDFSWNELNKYIEKLI